MRAQTSTNIREAALAGGYPAGYWTQTSTGVITPLDQVLAGAIERYTQQYEAATAGIPKGYQTIVRTDYRDKMDDAFYKIQGKIALFHTSQAQTPRKAAQKKNPK